MVDLLASLMSSWDCMGACVYVWVKWQQQEALKLDFNLSGGSSLWREHDRNGHLVLRSSKKDLSGLHDNLLVS